MRPTLKEQLDRIVTDLVDKSRYAGEIPPAACQACNDTGFVDANPDASGYKRVRECNGPAHQAPVREPAHIEAIKYR